MDGLASLRSLTSVSWSDALSWGDYVLKSLLILYALAALQLFFGVCSWRARQKAE